MKRSILTNNMQVHLQNILQKRGCAINNSLPFKKNNGLTIPTITNDPGDSDMFAKYADCLFKGGGEEFDQKYKPKLQHIRDKYDLIWVNGDMSVFNADEYRQLIQLIIDDKLFHMHLNIRHLLCSDDANNYKLNKVKDRDFKESLYVGALTKVKLYKQLDDALANNKEVSRELLGVIVKTFRIRQTKSVDMCKIKRTIQKDLFGDLFEYRNERLKSNNMKRAYVDIPNEGKILFHLKTFSLSSNLVIVDEKYNHIKSLITPNNDYGFSFIDNKDDTGLLSDVTLNH